jgi:hypothetical protein
VASTVAHHPRTWLAIPIACASCAGVALALRLPPEACASVGLLGAALAAAVRAFAGPSLAAALTGAAAALFGALAVLEIGGIDLPREGLAAAAAMFSISELVRPMPPESSALPSIGGALLAGILDPSFIALVPITGWRFIRGPWSRPRGSVALPLLGALACILAVIAALSPSGLLSQLWATWSARFASPISPLAVLTTTGDVLGPIAAVAGAAGVGLCCARGRYAAASVGAVTVGAIAVDLASGTLGAAVPTIAALGAGVAISRLTAMVRWPAGQAFVGATAGFMIVVAPALAHFLV